MGDRQDRGLDRGPDLEIRPLRPTDRERVLEITADVWGGRDYLPAVFDGWVADPSASFQGAELEGTLVGIQRLRPIAPGIALYEGLRVASSHRRLGVARAMLGSAIRESRDQGLRELRLVSSNPDAIRLFLDLGFHRLGAAVPWVAARFEGGDPARLASPADADRVWTMLRSDPALAAYGGINPHWHAPLDLGPELLARLAREGLVRLGPGGRAVAIVQPDPEIRLGVTFVAGSGSALRELLMALRHESDGLGLEGVWLMAPADHPAAADLGTAGYQPGPDALSLGVYGRAL